MQKRQSFSVLVKQFKILVYEKSRALKQTLGQIVNSTDKGWTIKLLTKTLICFRTSVFKMFFENINLFKNKFKTV